MTVDASSVPDKFQGFASDKRENWEHPKLISYDRKQLNDHDVVLKNETCGLCYSDIHTLRSTWGPYGTNELVVGHEICGTVIAVGPKVTEFKVGDRAGIGAASSSCRHCSRCTHDNEQYCKEQVSTYNSVDPKAAGYVTKGGYSSHSIADELFVFKVPDDLPFEYASPLFCAGITTFSPLYRNLVGSIKTPLFASKALNAKVVAFSRSSSKKEEALELGAAEFVATNEDKNWTSRYEDQFDLILNCASGIDGLNLSDYLSVLKVDKKFVSVGLPPIDDEFNVSPFTFLKQGASFGSSLLGSKAEVNIMLELAAKHNIRPWIEKVPISEENVAKALKRCFEGDVRYRFVFTEFDKAFGN
ncbi:NADP-dependent alcohol dehydrogenase 7 [Candida viswanathii]|uniref:NADP-dependent alcohol dehydrogenase 7 n=1 Tax=Candida viswanathii TaxID=5486 RepID=A0A367XW43_9ASCO|nr:NADP-dependent alcohol dehydrogenase 7 [Candida viswanathii]